MVTSNFDFVDALRKRPRLARGVAFAFRNCRSPKLTQEDPSRRTYHRFTEACGTADLKAAKLLRVAIPSK